VPKQHPFRALDLEALRQQDPSNIDVTISKGETQKIRQSLITLTWCLEGHAREEELEGPCPTLLYHKLEKIVNLFRVC
jgi:hypothetical protein